MSTQLAIYKQDCYDLARTLKIKSKFLAYNIELGVGIETSDAGWEERPKEEWRYYLNLAGEYHSLDTKMTVLSLDTQTEIVFDKETLKNHPTTKREYAVGGAYYSELVKRYPEQEHLIISILNPIEKDVSINAEEGTILWYRKDLVEVRESNLLEQLQDFIHRYYQAHLTNNSIDVFKHYYIVFLWGLYQDIVIQIQAIRLNNCKTDFAHSFHIWSYLDGFNRLGRYRDALTSEQVLYLYRNIERIHNSAGNNEIFDELITVFLKDRNISVFNYISRQNESELVDNLKATTELIKVKLGSDVSAGDSVLTIGSIMERGVSTSGDNGESLDLDVDKVQEDFDNANFDAHRTRTYEVEMNTSRDYQEYTLDDWLLNMWPILAIGNGKYNTTVAFENPITDELLTLSIGDAYVFYLYCYFRTLGITLDQVPLVFTSIGYKDGIIDRESILKIDTKRLLPNNYVENMLTNIPAVYDLKTNAEFFSKVSEFHDRWKDHLREYRSLERLDASSMGNLILSNLYRCWEIDPTGPGVKYDDWLLSRNLRVDNFTEQHYEDLTLSLFSEATGSVTAKELKLESIQNSMVSIVRQLSAYNLQFLQTKPQDTTFSLARKAVRYTNPITDSIAGNLPLAMGAYHYNLHNVTEVMLDCGGCNNKQIVDDAILQGSLPTIVLGDGARPLNSKLYGEFGSADMGHLRFGINFSNLHIVE